MHFVSESKETSIDDILIDKDDTEKHKQAFSGKEYKKQGQKLSIRT